jgi:hypothetical protein
VNRSSGRDKLDTLTPGRFYHARVGVPRRRGVRHAHVHAGCAARGLRGTRLAYLACAHLITCGSGCGQGLCVRCGHRLWRTAQRARELLIKSKV